MSHAYYGELETLHATLYRHREKENQELQNLIADMRAALDRAGALTSNPLERAA